MKDLEKAVIGKPNYLLVVGCVFPVHCPRRKAESAEDRK
jgi:hypothetical protein